MGVRGSLTGGMRPTAGQPYRGRELRRPRGKAERRKGGKAENFFLSGDMMGVMTTKEMHRVKSYSGVFEIGGAFLDGQRL